MRIVADSKIPLVEEAFAELGEVLRFHTCDLTPRMLRQAQVLLIRSETRIDARLLDGSGVEFVGTATIGTDHVDIDYLQRRRIGFANAPGSNARSVAEYLIASLLELAVRRGEELSGRSLGIVGVGNIGSLVERAGRQLGLRVLRNDPPRARAEPGEAFHSLEEVLQADIVTLHVPLQKTGPDPTYHLLDRTRLAQMRRGALLINTSRGAVVESAALLEELERGRLAAAVLDVWEGEPDIDCNLLLRTQLGTPHIAGHSWDGKVQGTHMIYQSCCRFFSLPPRWPDRPTGSSPRLVDWSALTGPASRESRLLELVRYSYDIREDDRRLRAILSVPSESRGHYFKRLRREYPVRREFSSLQVRVEDPEAARLLRGLGFAVARQPGRPEVRG